MRLLLSLWVVLILGLAGAYAWAGDEMRGIQRALNQAGLDAGPEDGIAGPQTRAAIARFRAHQGWSPGEVLAPQEVSVLLAGAPVERPQQILRPLPRPVPPPTAPKPALEAQQAGTPSPPWPAQAAAVQRPRKAYAPAPASQMGDCVQTPLEVGETGSALSALGCALRARAEAHGATAPKETCEALEAVSGTSWAALTGARPQEVLWHVAHHLLQPEHLPKDLVEHARACLAQGHAARAPNIIAQAALLLATLGEPGHAHDVGYALMISRDQRLAASDPTSVGGQAGHAWLRLALRDVGDMFAPAQEVQATRKAIMRLLEDP